jgi:ketosteroid isomerase-like protein
MRHVARLASAVALSALLLGCASTGDGAEASRDIGERAHGAYVTAINSNDLDAILAVLTDDVVFMPPGSPRLVGKPAVRSWAGGYLDAYASQWDKTMIEFVVMGDWAFEQYAYTSTEIPRGGGLEVRDTGKGLIIYRRDADGTWRVARDAWNSNRPAGSP